MEKEVDYTVVYMGENADDDAYSYITSKKFKAKAGETIQVNFQTHGLTSTDYAEIKHFTFEDRATSDEIMPDGSTVLIVYYSRKEYTITFTAEKLELKCKKPEHTHIRPNNQNSCYALTCQEDSWTHIHTIIGGCYELICGQEPHKHSNKCYGPITITKTITAKYQQDISKLWNNAVGPGTSLQGNNWLWDGEFSTAFQGTMPGEDKNLTPMNNGNTKHTLHYYIEDPSGNVTYKNKTFKLYTDVILNVELTTRPTFDEEFFVIDGYERYASTIKEWANGQENKDTNMWSWGEEESFYYTRAVYDLYLKSGDSERTEQVEYLSDISEYLMEPTPSPIPEGTFMGWYLDPEFTNLFTGTTMPKGLSLYAKWEPKSYTVTFKSDEMDYDTQTVIYGNTAKQPVRPPWKDEFIFDGWYTTPDGDEKYDFNAPVTENTVIYAKWTPITDTTYTVRYMTAGGRTVAQSKNGTGNVGDVIQEFAVKPHDEFSDYTVDQAEKTLKLTADASQNVITFVYTYVRDLHYTIEYRDIETNELIYSRENIPSEANHLVVYPSEEDRKALDAKGYELVDHHKDVDLTVDGDNIVIFNCQKGEYTITYTGDTGATYPNGNNPTSYTYGDTIYLKNPQKSGYMFNGWEFVSEGGQISGNVHDGMNTVIESTSHGNLDFEATWTALEYTVNYNAAGGTPTPAAKTNVGWNQSALLPMETPTRNGYKLTGWTYNGTTVTPDMTYAQLAGEDTVTSITLTAQWIDDSEQQVQVTYEAWPAQGGNVTPKAQMIQIANANGLTGSEATANTGYKFIGWFKENQLVTTETVLNRENALNFLEKKGDTYEATTFTAQFEIDETKTKELKATVDYVLGKDMQTDDRMELRKTVHILDPDFLPTTDVTAKTYLGWKLDKITVNGETVETLPSEVKDGTKVIYYYVADFTDLKAAGFEEFYNGQTWKVSVSGTLEGDVIRYYKMDEHTEEIQNSFVNVSDSTAVKVEVTRGSESWTTTVNATVKPVEVELTADSDKKVYDGTPLEVSTYKITSGEFVSDEGLENVTVEGSQTYVGSSDSEITAYTFKNDTLEENYNIICKPGTLTVTEEGVDPKDVMIKTHEDKTYVLGDVITFTIKVKNIYDKPCDITINEQTGVKITGESKFTAVKSGEEVSTTAVYTVTEADLLAGKFMNTVTATIDENVHKATDIVDKFEKPTSHLTVNKKTTSTPKDGVAYTLGETITYAVTAVNDGNLTLTNVTVTDELTEDVWKIETLTPGESRTFEAKYLVTEEDMKNVTVKNVAIATVETPNPEHPETIVVPGETEDPIVTKKASLWLEKTVDSEKDKYEVGDTIHVVNNGNVTIYDIEVRDPLTDDVWTIKSLASGEDQKFHAEYVITEADAKNGSVTNTAIATGKDQEGKEVKTDDTAKVTVELPKQKDDDPKDDTPIKPNKKESPKTGDQTNIAKWLLLIMIAAGVLLAGAVSRKRRRSCCEEKVK